MKFPKYNIPKAIFLYLLMEYRCLSASHAEPVTIFFDKLSPIPFAYPISKIIPEHSSDDSTEYRSDDVGFSPESSHKNHNIHPRYSGTDNRKWLDACREKCYEIVPVSEWLYQLTDPLDTGLYSLWSYERYNDERESKNSKENCEEFCDWLEDELNGIFHPFTLYKTYPFAKESRVFRTIIIDKILNITIRKLWA